MVIAVGSAVLFFAAPTASAGEITAREAAGIRRFIADMGRDATADLAVRVKAADIGRERANNVGAACTFGAIVASLPEMA